MFLSSLNAIRKMLKDTFPDVTTTYINRVPNGFVRPSFFVQLATTRPESLTLMITAQAINWMIVYFPKESEAGDPDVFNQLDVSDRLVAKLQEFPAITAPDGRVYHITDIDGGPRDTEVYISVTLEGQGIRTRPEYDLMQEIEIIEGG